MWLRGLPERCSSAALQVGDQALAHFQQLVGLDAEPVVPGAGRRPHLVVLQQVGIDEHAEMRLVTEGRRATDGLLTPEAQRLRSSSRSDSKYGSAI